MALLGAAGVELQGEPAAAALQSRLDGCLAPHLGSAAHHVDLGLSELVGASGDLWLAFVLLGQLPTGVARLCLHDRSGQLHEGEAALARCDTEPAGTASAFYRFDLDTLRRTWAAIKAAG